MHNKVRKYFEDFESLQLKRKNGAVLFSDHHVALDQNREIPNHNFTIRPFTIDNIPVIVKRWQGSMSLFSLASTQMYTDIGILTPPEYIMTHNPKSHIKVSHGKRDYENLLCTYTQDVHSIRRINSQIAKEIIEYKKIISNCGDRNYKWALLTEQSLRHKFLSFMTEKCLNELLSLHLADELRSETDRHLNNFFLYKTKDSDKYDGVIAIDNGFGQIAQESVSFDDLKVFTYGSATPQNGTHIASYPHRVEELRDLLYAGYINKNQIRLLRKELSYDLPATIKSTCKQYKLKGKQYNNILYDNTAKLWQYNQETIGRDLGL